MNQGGCGAVCCARGESVRRPDIRGEPLVDVGVGLTRPAALDLEGGRTMRKKMNRREKKLVQEGFAVRAVASHKKRTGRSLRESMDELRRVKAQQGPQH